MRVRIIKNFITGKRGYQAGEVVTVSPKKAEAWLGAGLVIQEKSLDGAKETKSLTTIREV